MRRYLNIWIISLLLLSSCAPATPRLDLPSGCSADTSKQKLVRNHWLNQGQIWRLRQSALLEIGTRKTALEGFVRLDLKQREVRLVALNEMGLVVFDLHVDAHSEELMRALPQIHEIEGFATGVGNSLRRMFLAPRPRLGDNLEHRGHYQRLVQSGFTENADEELEFIFDCAGNLRRTRLQSAAAKWQVLYADYRAYALESGDVAIPARIVLHNPERRMKLTLTLNEIRQE
ncbi:MAG: DUF3261 domain-containing protein [Geobacteraceae bacterium]|nr:DUF3261 domain-containing protein [Geobacteraceae bacterium]